MKCPVRGLADRHLADWELRSGCLIPSKMDLVPLTVEVYIMFLRKDNNNEVEATKQVHTQEDIPWEVVL